MSENCVHTVQEVAGILRVSTKTVYKMIKAQELTSVRVRGQIRIPSCVLNQFMKGESDNEEKQKWLSL